jgi:hypothetical protein
MTRRVGILPLSLTLSAVLSAGCVSPGNDKAPLLPDWPRPAPEPPAQTAAAAPRPSLPADWSIREQARPDPGIRQAIYPETVREQKPPAKPAGEPPETPAATEQPDPLPAFEIRTKPEEPLVAALRCCLDKHPAEAVDYLKGYDRPNQEALLCLLPLAARLSQGGLDGARPQEAAEMLDGLHSLELSLRQRASLRIEKMCFCKWIESFGRYEPLADGHAAFQAGSAGRMGEPVYVYAEVRNFASTEPGPVHAIRLTSWGEVRDYAQGKTVARINFDNKADESRSVRQDLFVNYSFRVPAHLPPGPYTLWIYVQDALAPSTRPPAQKSLDFQVIAGGSARCSRGEPGGLAAR